MRDGAGGGWAGAPGSPIASSRGSRKGGSPRDAALLEGVATGSTAPGRSLAGPSGGSPDPRGRPGFRGVRSAGPAVGAAPSWLAMGGAVPSAKETPEEGTRTTGVGGTEASRIPGPLSGASRGAFQDRRARTSSAIRSISARTPSVSSHVLEAELASCPGRGSWLCHGPSPLTFDAERLRAVPWRSEGVSPVMIAKAAYGNFRSSRVRRPRSSVRSDKGESSFPSSHRRLVPEDGPPSSGRWGGPSVGPITFRKAPLSFIDGRSSTKSERFWASSEASSSMQSMASSK